MTRIYLVDDHPIIIEGLYTLLQHVENITVVGHAYNAGACLQYLQSHAVDVVLMDVNIPEVDGIALCRKIKAGHPQVMVLALSTYGNGTYVSKMIENGASGYLLKNAGKQEIVDAIKLVALGKTYMSFEAGQNLRSNEQKYRKALRITKREKQVLSLVAEGLTNSQIGEKLFISPDTVDSHRKNLHIKLNVNNTAMLVRAAVENDLL